MSGSLYVIRNFLIYYMSFFVCCMSILCYPNVFPSSCVGAHNCELVCSYMWSYLSTAVSLSVYWSEPFHMTKGGCTDG